MEKFDYASEFCNYNIFSSKNSKILNQRVYEAQVIDEYFKSEKARKYIIRSFCLRKKMSVEDRINYIIGLIYSELYIYSYHKKLISNKKTESISKYKSKIIKTISSSDGKGKSELKMIKKGMNDWFYLQSLMPKENYYYKYIISDDEIENISKLL